MRRRLLPLALLLCAPASARAGDFVDTRLNFTLTDENVLVKPGETNPSVPGLRIDKPNSLGLLFFDNYDTRYSGYENLTHAVLYKKVQGSRFDAEGAFVLRLLEFSDVNLTNLDDGSYIKVTYFLDPTREKKTNVSFVAFPLSSDRMRLGFSYRISWGGSPIFFKYNPDLPTAGQTASNTTPAPGARLMVSGERFNAWIGAKTSILLNRNPEVNEQEAVYALLAGAALDVVPDFLRIEANGGYFDRGTNQNLYSTQLIMPGQHYKDYRVETYGGSGQISLFHGVNPSGSLDYTLYKNDPTSASRYFTRPEYKPGFNWLAQAEFTAISTTLQNADKVDSTKRQMAYAGDINLRAQVSRLRFKLDAAFRSLAFVLQNQPSLVPYQDFPSNATWTDDFFVSAGFDINLPNLGLTIGPTVGFDVPATFTPPSGDKLQQLCGNTAGSLCSSSTIVVRGEGDYSILPEGKGVVPVWAAKALARLDFLDYFALILDVYFNFDQNQTHLTKDALGNFLRDFNNKAAAQLGFNFTLQARF
jgi:hypothetical protein